MKFLKRLTLAYHIIGGMFFIVIMGLFLLHMISLESIMNLIFVSYVDHNVKMMWLGFMLISLGFNYLLFRMLSKSSSEHQVIMFDSPSGKVRVSIFALEELAKRVASGIPEVQSVQARMEKNSKGLDVDLKMTLCSDANVLEITSRVQNLVRRRIQETISLEQAVNVSAYVSKIDSVNIDSKAIKGTTKNPYTDIHVPFHGYRA